uniref:Uncharacterized protein n=1 Tax=Arundo donax TaxID=35708 RepID=A0A0A8Y899_ARUDO
MDKATKQVYYSRSIVL